MAKRKKKNPPYIPIEELLVRYAAAAGFLTAVYMVWRKRYPELHRDLFGYRG